MFILDSRKERSHMKPSAFDYVRVDTLDEALSVLADSDLEAKVLAGGQSLLPLLNMRLAQPKALVDINRLAALATLGRLERNVAGEEFFQSYFTTAIEPDEMLTKTLWPLPAPDEGIAFKEYRRRHGDFALLAAACTMKIGSDRTVQHVRLGLGGVADTPLLIDEVRELVGEHWAKERVRTVAEAVVNRLDFADDYQASSSYRQQLATVLISSVLDAAYEDALAKEGKHGVDQG